MAKNKKNKVNQDFSAEFSESVGNTNAAFNKASSKQQQKAQK
ncbi:hypothetical protein [Paenibacillus protaetiae]|nr:hypothetical protein [Paenibacillus protaetiae]